MKGVQSASWVSLTRSAELRPVLRPFAPFAPLLLILGLLAAAFEGFGIGLLIPLIGAMTGSQAAGAGLFDRIGHLLPAENRILLLAGAMIVLIVAKNVIIYANSLLCAWIYGRTSAALRSRLAGRLTEMDLATFERQRPGRLLHIVSNESWRTADAIQAGLSLISASGMAAILAGFLLLLSWRMTFAVVAGLLLLHWVHGRLSRSLCAHGTRLSHENGALASRMLHIINAARLLRAFSAEASERRAFDASSEKVRGAVFAIEARKALLGPLMDILQISLFLAVVAVAWSIGVGFAVIAAFLILLYRLQPQLRSLQNCLAQLDQFSGAIGEVEWLLRQPGPTAPVVEQDFHGLGTGIAFDAVGLCYGERADERALDAVSLHIGAGRSTAIVGRSGSGKSSLVSILARFVEPTAGRVTIDGVPLDRIAVARWRERLSIVSPELELVEGSIEENIRYGRPDADREAIVQAARLADAHAFITSFPDGYATTVGYRGLQLSAGQRQRISLARALIRDPELLILDEATNALDRLSEAAVIGTLRRRAGRGTTIVISHDVDALDFCDDVVLLDRGRIVATGPRADFSGPRITEIFRGTLSRSVEGGPA